MDKPVLTGTVSLAQKVGLPNYGHAECFLSISNITPDTTPEQMDQMLDQTSLGWTKIRERIKAEVARIKTEQGI